MAPPSAASRDIDLAAAIAALFRTRAAQLGWFLAFALLTRVSVYGDTNFFNDEYFYFQVGLRMHAGELPYVDMWDRKGPGLFLTYWFFAFFSRSILAYQIAGTLFAAATAYVVNLIAERFSGRVGAMLGGTLYLVMLATLGGASGQTPVFYNLWIALAALAVVNATPALRQGEMPRYLYAAMACAGFAITYKQTAASESVFLGLYALWQMARGGVPLPRLIARGAGMALAGMAPMLAFTAFYAAAGHFPEFWHAMVTANLRKTYETADAGSRLLTLVMLFAPLWLPALAAFLVKPQAGEQGLSFPAGWSLAGIGGVALVPSLYEHYLLPLCVPASVLAARALGFRLIGPAFTLFAALFWLMAGPAMDFAKRNASREAMAGLTRDILARDPHPRPLVYAGPVDLYRQFDTYPPSALYYPTHLGFDTERDVSHLRTEAELRRILAWRPSIVLTYGGKPALTDIPVTGPLVHAYVTRNCRLWFERELPEAYVSHRIQVWGDCARDR